MTRTSLSCFALTLLALWLVGPLSGAEAKKKLKKVDISLEAETRTLIHGLSAIYLDKDKTPYGQNSFGEQRLRLGAKFLFRKPRLGIHVQFDVMTGLLYGDTTTVGQGRLMTPRHEAGFYKGFTPRKLYLEWITRRGMIRFGHMTSFWGMGLLASSGDRDLPFGHQRYGDIVERFMFASRPFSSSQSKIAKNLVTAIGVDLVFRDDNADLTEGDVGVNAILSLFYKDRKSFLGTYVTYRHQKDRDDASLKVVAVDVAGAFKRKLSKNVGIGVNFEAVGLFGRTTRLRPDAYKDGVDVAAFAAAGRVSFFFKKLRMGVALEVGVASGDNNPNDQTHGAFTMDPDYRVGMVMFSELMAAITANAADRLNDLSRVGRAQPGSSFYPTNGAVTNAVYIWPRIWFKPFKGFKVKLGLLYGRALADVYDPYLSYQAGGVNRTTFDRAADERDLGFEIHAGLEYKIKLYKRLKLKVSVEWGHLFPGSVFQVNDSFRHVQVDHGVGQVMLVWR